MNYAQQLCSSKHGAGRLGCSFHSGENGWAQLMREHRKYPTCEACDGDRKRRRACACIYSSDSSTQEHVCRSSRQDCECLERLWHVLFGEQPVLPLHHIYDKMRFQCATPRLSTQANQKLKGLMQVKLLPRIGFNHLPSEWRGDYSLLTQNKTTTNAAVVIHHHRQGPGNAAGGAGVSDPKQLYKSVCILLHIST